MPTFELLLIGDRLVINMNKEDIDHLTFQGYDGTPNNYELTLFEEAK